MELVMEQKKFEVKVRHSSANLKVMKGWLYLSLAFFRDLAESSP